MKLSIPILLLLSLVPCVRAQTADSLRVEYSQAVDSTAGQAVSNKLKYRLLDFMYANYEEKTLIKIGFVGLPPIIALYESTVEQKVAPGWSVGAGAFTTQAWGPGIVRAVTINSTMYVRHYYSMKRRIREGRSAANLAGSYLMVNANVPVYNRITVLDPSRYEGEATVKVFSRAALTWGNQKRLGRFGYFDVRAGLNYIFGSRPQSYLAWGRFGVSADLLFGFGL